MGLLEWLPVVSLRFGWLTKHLHIFLFSSMIYACIIQISLHVYFVLMFGLSKFSIDVHN